MPPAATSGLGGLTAPRTTLTQFVLEEHKTLWKESKDPTGTFTRLMVDIASACKVISMLVNKGPKLGILGKESTENVQGEIQKTLDVITDDVFRSHTENSGCLAGMLSEENPDHYPIPDEEKAKNGKYLLCFDPLDGSSNIEVNVSVGTIFSIFEKPEGYAGKIVDNQAFHQAGTRMVAAGYCVYGPQTTFVYTTGHGVNGFVLDQDVGDFFLEFPDMKIPEQTKEFAVNTSNYRHWDAPVRRYIDECQAGSTGPRGKDFNMRWVGSMVADVHRILTRGGVFMYPLDAKLRKQGLKGRLRYLYEVAPMAFLVEQAGGASTDGYVRSLEIVPQSLHERAPVFLGSKEEVEVVTSYHQQKKEAKE